MANSRLLPRLVPGYFVFNKQCQIAAIYQEPLGQGLQDGITLMFSGGPPDAAPKRVVPERVDSRTLLFNTPVYSKMPPSESVSVLPILFTKSENGHGNEQIDLPSFQIRVQDPIRSLIETSINVFPQDDLLPVLIMFMLHHKGEHTPFKDERFDKVMTCLIENRDVQSSSSIRDIILPGKKWQRMNIHDFCIEHSLPLSTKASKPLKEGRRIKARSTQETSSAMQDLQSIYSSFHRHRNPVLEDVVYDVPVVTTNSNTKKTSSASSLVGEPIDRENPPAHFLFPPGSESDMSDTYYDNRLFARSTQSEDDKPSMARTFKQQQRFSDSDSALNRMSDQAAHRDQRKDRNYSASPSTTQSPLFHVNSSGNRATDHSSTANASPTMTSRLNTPIPVPRSTLPQGQLSPITSTENTGPMGQQLITVGPQQRPVPRPRQQGKQNKTPPPGTSDHDPEDMYDDIVHLSRGLGQDQTAFGARQPPLVPKKPNRQS